MGPRDARGFELLALPAQVREMDRRTIEDLAVPGRVLMELAGAGAAREIMARTGGVPGRALALCGGGNNGGDGYVIARHLRDAGWRVQCVAAAPTERLGGEARANFRLWERLGGVTLNAADEAAELPARMGHADVIVDALFGTGLSRGVEGAAAALIEMANGVTRPLKVAVDVPSGVHAGTGAALGVALRADVTTTFGVSKVGLHQGGGASLAGDVVVVTIGLPREVVEEVGAVARLANPEAVAALLPSRAADGHKGSYGHVAILGGFAGKGGAARLAARGALRVGAGLVTWATPGAPPSRDAEVMHHDLDEGLDPRATVFVVGPGLGTDAVAGAVLDGALADPRPKVLDADGLNLLAARDERGGRVAGQVLTPHPREASRLLGCSVADVQRDRLAAARVLVDRFGAVVVLKGARTVVAAPGEAPVLFELPAPALSQGGTGDVLAGAIGGLVAQGAAPFEAALAAVWIHAQAGRLRGAGRADRGVLASEIADALPEVIDALVDAWT